MAGENGNDNTNHKVIGISISRSAPVIVHPAGAIQAGGAATYFLSNLDQNLAVTMKTIYCFSAKDRGSTEKVGENLRASLEKVLDYFYVFDGRFAVDEGGKLVVLMNAGGVPFVEAEADCELEELGEVYNPELRGLGELVYCPPADSIFEVPLLTVQVTRFKCGGYVVGLGMNHSIADGLSAVGFLNAWAETTRGLPLSLPPFLDRSLLASRLPPTPEFPHPSFTDLAASLTDPSPFPSLPIIHKHFTFDAAKLSRLKILATAPGNPSQQPSTFVALAALIWRARTKALNIPPSDPTKLLFAVDGRNKLDPPLPAGFFGNSIVFACCLCAAGELVNNPLSHAAQMVQTANREISNGFIRSTIDYYELHRGRPSLAGTLMLTDWTRLEFGATDFGWGRVTHTGPSELPVREVALFLPPAKGSKGTVLLLGLPAPAMTSFQDMLDF